MSTLRHKLHAFVLCLALAPVALAACGDDDDGDAPVGAKDGGKHPGSSRKDAGSGREDAGARDAGEPECHENPKTHAQIVNACTDEEVVDKQPDLPLLLPDGGLPPLP